jgi:ABC-2 type transport system permease protein
MSEPSAPGPLAKPLLPGSGRQRRALEQAAVSASGLLVMAIVLMVNYLAFRHYKRMDWTAEALFTLSPKSLTVLRGLQQDVELYLFLSQGEPSFENTDELIKRYKAASPHLKTHYVDPDRNPSEFKLLAQRFGVQQGATASGEARADLAAVVVRGTKNWHINREDLVGWEMGGGAEQAELNVKAEQALTGAIVQVMSGRPTKVCVTKGHGEWALEEGNERSLASLKNGLRHDNIEWQAFETLGKKLVPADCDALFVLGPQRAFADSEAQLVLDYVKQGGNALLALDPVIEHDEIQPTGFEDPLKGVGVRLDRSLAIELDQEHLLSPNTIEFMVTGFGDHATTRALKDRGRVVVAIARSLSVLEHSDKIEVLLRTSDKAFGATDIAHVGGGDKEPARSASDIAGPLDLALAVRAYDEADAAKKKLGGRLIVVGDSDFLQSSLLEAPELANFHLASAWTGWLTQREALIEIAPKKIKGGNIVFTQDTLWALLFRVGVLLPGAALLLGVAVWFNRRS